METLPTIADEASPPLEPDVQADMPPWDIAPAREASPSPRVRETGKAMALPARNPVHWSVAVLTALTALVLVSATQADDRSRVWEFAPAALAQR